MEMEFLIMQLFMILQTHMTIMKFVMKEPFEMTLDVKLHVQSSIFTIHVPFLELLVPPFVEMASMIQAFHSCLQLLDNFMKFVNTHHLLLYMIDLNTCF